MDALIAVWEPLEDQHDKGKELDEEGQDEDGRDELVELESVQQVRNVTSGDARPEYDLGDGGDLVEEDDSKEIANAKDEGEECDSKQYDVVEAQARIKGKEKSEYDIDDKDKKRNQELDVVGHSPRNSLLLVMQVVLLLFHKSQQCFGDEDDKDDQGQACSYGVEVQDEV